MPDTAPTEAHATPTDERTAPRLDEDGILRLGDRWVAIPDAQLPVVALLVDRYGRLVRREAVAAAYVEAGNSGRDASIRSLMARVARRVGSLGLQLHTVRGRGVILAPSGDQP